MSTRDRERPGLAGNAWQCLDKNGTLSDNICRIACHQLLVLLLRLREWSTWHYLSPTTLCWTNWTNFDLTLSRAPFVIDNASPTVAITTTTWCSLLRDSGESEFHSINADVRVRMWHRRNERYTTMTAVQTDCYEDEM